MRLFLAMVALVLVLLIGASGAGAVPGGVQTGLLERRAVEQAFVPGELVVQFREGVSVASRRDALTLSDARLAGSLGSPGLTLIRLPEGASVRASAARLARDPRVVLAEPNYLYGLTQIIPNDLRFAELWGLNDGADHDIDAPEAWDIQQGSSDIVVAVIDSGIAYDHPDLAGNMWVNPLDPPGGGDDDGNGYVDDVHGADFVNEDAVPLDHNGHGTHVAGTIGAEGNNARGVTGVNWDVSLMALRAANGKGSLAASNIMQAVNYACEHDVQIVNGSFGGQGKSQALANRIKSVDCRDTLFVFAAGNDGQNLNGNAGVNNAYPCEYHRPAPHGFSVQNIICVAATTRSDAIASFSNRGTSAVHLAAPGGNGNGTDILSTWPEYSTVWGPDGIEAAGTWGDPINLGNPAAPDWNRTTLVASSGSFSLTDSPGGNYVNNALTTIRNMNVINLAGRFGCLLEYDLRLETEPGFDFFGIFGGTTTFANEEEVDAFSGSTGGTFVQMVEGNLTSFDGEPEVYIRFFMDTDGSERRDGAYVDNVLVKCVAANGEGYKEIPGTSMATPHVASVAALLLAQEPTQSTARLKNAILKGVDRKPNLVDHVSTGGRLNADSSLAIAMDHTPPNTTITSRPANRTSKRKATFRFTSNEAGSAFQCRHMTGPWLACSSPKVYSGLGPGMHQFAVRAIDKNGNVDSTPAKDTWRIRR